MPNHSTSKRITMESSPKGKERNGEIVTFFYTIFSHRIRGGTTPDEARKEAYDAVTLRYGIGKGRLLNIISGQKGSQRVNNYTLRQNALALINELQVVNEGLDETRSKNERLIGLLKECVEDDNR